MDEGPRINEKSKKTKTKQNKTRQNRGRQKNGIDKKQTHSRQGCLTPVYTHFTNALFTF